MSRLIDEDKLLLDIIDRGVDHIQTDDYAEICQIIAEQPTVEDKPQGEYKVFAKWVAIEILDDYWKYNRDAFAEIACRKLAKMGIVRAIGDEWELAEPQERSDKE